MCFFFGESMASFAYLCEGLGASRHPNFARLFFRSSADAPIVAELRISLGSERKLSMAFQCFRRDSTEVPSRWILRQQTCVWLPQ
jgi:hypothetical protein